MSPEERKRKARERTRRYRLAHPEKQKAYDRRPDVVAKRLEYTKAWRARQPKPPREDPPPGAVLERRRERGRATARRWYRRNAGKSKAASTAYAKANAERINAARRARYATDQAHRLRVNAYNAGRHKFGRGGSLTPGQWREIWDSYLGLCAYCPARATSMDHVVPRKGGGRHEAGNVVPACKACNSSKRARPLLRWLLSRGILATWPSRGSGASRFSSASRGAESCSAR